mmetsp:Transcript_8716/g.18234  ORF Transcript_8716/g.18234 Transcript_8716/m.18234 type:complete len:211 (-) Transcript_8716:147-779(-)
MAAAAVLVAVLARGTPGQVVPLGVPGGVPLPVFLLVGRRIELGADDDAAPRHQEEPAVVVAHPPKDAGVDRAPLLVRVVRSVDAGQRVPGVGPGQPVGKALARPVDRAGDADAGVGTALALVHLGDAVEKGQAPVVPQVELRGPVGSIVEFRLGGHPCRLVALPEEALTGLPVPPVALVAPPGFETAVVAVLLGLAGHRDQLVVPDRDDP